MRRLVSAVRPRSMHPLHMQTRTMSTIEQIVAGKYKVELLTATQLLGYDVVFA